MRLLLSSFATAALALVASAAPAAPAAPAALAPEVTTDLPARFGLIIVTAEERVNGRRLQYVNSRLETGLNADKNWPGVDGVFLGGRGRIALDRTVHKRPDSNSPTNPEPWGDWNMVIFPGVDTVVFNSEERQAQLTSWGPDYFPTVDKWVQNSNGLLRLVGGDGAVRPNGLRLCGLGQSAYIFWWDNVPYLNCPVAEFRIVPL